MAAELAERFQEPPGFRWHQFTREGRTIRFGSVFPREPVKPKALVIVLPGLGEFIEKYYETCRNLLENGFAVGLMDWMGQGKSGRYFEDDPYKRHSGGFHQDIEDLDYFLKHYMKPMAVLTDVGRLPFALLAHSMGGNLGLRYLAEHPDVFSCAAFSAPMAGIKGIPTPAWPALKILHWVLGTSFAPGQGNWDDSPRKKPDQSLFSSDPERARVHYAWFEKEPGVQIHGVTYGWVYQALRACAHLHRNLHTITTPCVIAAAGKDDIVDSNAVRRAARQIPNAELLELPEARHEILMERDESRDALLKSFYALIKTHIIDKPETIKKF